MADGINTLLFLLVPYGKKVKISPSGHIVPVRIATAAARESHSLSVKAPEAG
jgi:hypothetical protein